jgi:hypothetical protein
VSVTTRVASASDLSFLADLDQHISRDRLAELVAARLVMVAELDGGVAGFLRWGLFWDQVPFMNLLWILPDLLAADSARPWSTPGRGLSAPPVTTWC